MRNSKRELRLYKIGSSIIWGGSAYCLVMLVLGEYTNLFSSIWVRVLVVLTGMGLLFAFIGVLTLQTIEHTSGKPDSK